MTEIELVSEVAAFIASYTAMRNAHDAKGMAQFYAGDADLIGANGVISTGREAIYANLQREHASVYRNSVARRLVDRVYAVTETVAVVTGRFLVKGTRSSEDDRVIDQRPGIFTMVIRRGGAHGWEIVAYRSMVPEDVFSAAGTP